MKVDVKWNFEADYIQGCNCDYGCPCEFEAPPTQGFCDGAGAWNIIRGQFGDVRLDGLGLAYAAHWPKAIHQGNGTGVIFCDERATSDQRKALLTIASGEAGGLPFEIIATTFSKLLDPQFVRFEFQWDGRNSRAKIGNALELGVEPIKNPVTGSTESVRVVHQTGFVFKEAEVVSAKDCRCSMTGLSFSWPNKAGFVARVKYGN